MLQKLTVKDLKKGYLCIMGDGVTKCLVVKRGDGEKGLFSIYGKAMYTLLEDCISEKRHSDHFILKAYSPLDGFAFGSDLSDAVHRHDFSNMKLIYDADAIESKESK